jgi:hypothetical protein
MLGARTDASCFWVVRRQDALIGAKAPVRLTRGDTVDDILGHQRAPPGASGVRVPFAPPLAPAKVRRALPPRQFTKCLASFEMANADIARVDVYQNLLEFARLAAPAANRSAKTSTLVRARFATKVPLRPQPIIPRWCFLIPLNDQDLLPSNSTSRADGNNRNQIGPKMGPVPTYRLDGSEAVVEGICEDRKVSFRGIDRMASGL